MKLDVAWTWDGAALGDDERVAVRAELSATALIFSVDAPFHGDPPPVGPPGPTDGLWEHEVVELFLVGAGERYLEVEVGPAGHFLVLQLHGARNAVARLLPADVRVARQGARWSAEVRVDGALVPPDVCAANAFAIHGVGTARRYLVHAPLATERPDFHRIDRFPRWIDPRA